MTFFSTPNKTFKSTTLIRTTNESVYSFTYICFSGEVLSPLKKKQQKKTNKATGASHQSGDNPLLKPKV